MIKLWSQQQLTPDIIQINVNMKYFLVRPVLAALFLLAISSCNEKQDNGVGIGLFAGENDLGVSYVDTFNIISRIKYENSVKSSGFTDALLGSYHDPFFGDTKVSFYTQFLINRNGITFSDSAVCDSVVFYAKLGIPDDIEFYGPENKEMTFNLHRINNDANYTIDSIYYTHSSIEIYNESLLDPSFNNTFTANFLDTIQIGLDSNLVAGVFQLKLDPLFGQEIIDLAGTEVLLNNEEFLKVYKGLYITTDGDQDGTILSIDYTSDATTMIMYYHVDTIVKEFEFEISSTSTAHFNEFKHNYVVSGSNELNAILNDTNLANKKYFLQTGGGFSVGIEMPTLHSLIDSLGAIPVNKAELVMPVDPNSVEDYVPVEQFFILRIADDGRRVAIDDQGSFNLGGKFDDEKMEYRFIITEHIQSFISGKINSPNVLIEVKKPGYSPNRSILYGHKADTTLGEKPLLLRIYYSTLNN
jgi:hypothetical protein